MIGNMLCTNCVLSRKSGAKLIIFASYLCVIRLYWVQQIYGTLVYWFIDFNEKLTTFASSSLLTMVMLVIFYLLCRVDEWLKPHFG